jgi:hypothetical protein
MSLKTNKQTNKQMNKQNLMINLSSQSSLLYLHFLSAYYDKPNKSYLNFVFHVLQICFT